MRFVEASFDCILRCFTNLGNPVTATNEKKAQGPRRMVLAKNVDRSLTNVAARVHRKDARSRRSIRGGGDDVDHITRSYAEETLEILRVAEPAPANPLVVIA